MIGAAKAYKTLSTEAATVIAGARPLDLVIDEMKQRTAERNPDKAREMLGMTDRAEVDRSISIMGRIHPAEVTAFRYDSEAANCTKAVKIYTDGSRTRNGAGVAVYLQ